jgi:protein SCO1
MKNSNAGMADKHIFLLIFLVAVAAGAGLWLGGRVMTPSVSLAETQPGAPPNTIAPYAFKSLLVYPQPKIVPAFALTQPSGAAFDAASLTGHWTLLSFGFTTCPDVCPTTLTELNGVVAAIKQAALPAPTVAFISIDPERDSAELLGPYVQHYGSTFVAATADVATLTSFAASLGAVFEKVQQGTGAMDYTMAHTATIFLINPRGEIAALARPTQQSTFDWPQLRSDVPAFLAAVGGAPAAQLKGAAP